MDQALMIKTILISILLCVSAHGQLLQPIVNQGGVVSGGSMTIGSITGSSTLNCGTRGICIIPFLTFTGSSGFTAPSLQITGTAGTGNVNLGIYDSTGATCPTGLKPCAGALVCSTGSTVFSISTLTLTPTSCGTLAANTMYYAALQTSATGITFTALAAGVYCPSNGVYGMKGPTPGSFALPTPMGTQTEPSGAQCLAAQITATCAGSCGVAPIPWTIFDYAGNTNGTTLTTANLLTGTECPNGQFSGTVAAATYSNTQTHALPTGAICNGNSFTGGTVSISHAASSGNAYNYNLNGNGSAGGSATTVFGYWLDDTSNTMGSGDQVDMGGQGGGNSLLFGMYFGASAGDCGSLGNSPCLKIEEAGGTTQFFGTWAFTPGTWYFVVTQNNSGGTHRGAVWNTSGTEIASSTENCATGDTSNACIVGNNAGNTQVITMLDAGSSASTGGTIFYGPQLFDPTGNSWSTIGSTYGMFFPDSPSVIGNDLAKEVADGTIPRAKILDGGWYSYALGRYL
jgi:hypothetical protein